MKVYLLKESDFDKLKLLIEKIEAEEKADPATKTSLGDLRRRYRFDIFGWINEVQEPKS